MRRPRRFKPLFDAVVVVKDKWYPITDIRDPWVCFIGEHGYEDGYTIEALLKKSRFELEYEEDVIDKVLKKYGAD